MFKDNSIIAQSTQESIGRPVDRYRWGTSCGSNASGHSRIFLARAALPGTLTIGNDMAIIGGRWQWPQ